MSEQYEVRVGYYGGLVLTSEMLKAQRFQIEMEQHYRQLKEEQELELLWMTERRRSNLMLITLTPFIIIYCTMFYIIASLIYETHR